MTRSRARCFDEPEQELPLPEPETNGQTKNGQKANGRQKKKGKPKRKALDDLLKKLPRETITIEPDGDTSGMTCIGAEKTLVLERVPAHRKVIEYVRPKYVDPGDEDKGVIIGELPPRMVNKGMAGGLAAGIATALGTVATTDGEQGHGGSGVVGRCGGGQICGPPAFVPSAAAVSSGRRGDCEVHAGRLDIAVCVAPDPVV